ncbi:MAG: hypothetical protein AAB708_01390, partial [Patescibacteria group bacterium]
MFAFILVILSMFNVEVGYAKDKPIWGNSCGRETSSQIYSCSWDESRHEWIETYVGWDNWEFAESGRSPEGAARVRQMHEPYRVPVKKTYTIELRELYRAPEQLELATMLGAAHVQKGRRFVGVNVEAGTWPDESKVWPHLGLTYVGTVAKESGYHVTLHDELIQGPVPLEKLVQPGDIVGLSLVTTGIERGVILAREAKALGAGAVIAGNDSAMFRADQLLRIPDKPIDVIFTSNSLRSLRKFFEDPEGVTSGAVHIDNVATKAGQSPYISNDAHGVALERKAFTAEDFFLIPDLSLFGAEYWDEVWSIYRSQFGHKHPNPSEVRNAIALLAQGCGRAGMGDVCDYCTIRHVANVVIPDEDYLEKTISTYRDFGINTFFNVTDSSFEMGKLAERMQKLGPVDALVLYGRAQAISGRPDLLEKWKGVVNDRLLINCGMDSGSERILQLGINKSGSKVGSRLEENRQAVRNIKAAGPKVHLHFSVIFGSPGETHETCEETLQFVSWAIDTLGEQLDVVEGDIFWVNFGAPCSEIFTSYEATQKRAALAGKTISREDWYEHFGRHADELVVPDSAERAWYTFFTDITIEDAWAYNARVTEMAKGIP